MDASETESGPDSQPRLGRSVSLDDAAGLLGVSRRTIYNRIRRGDLKTVRTIGGSQRVLLDSIDQSARPRGVSRTATAFELRADWRRR